MPSGMPACGCRSKLFSPYSDTGIRQGLVAIHFLPLYSPSMFFAPSVGHREESLYPPVWPASSTSPNKDSGRGRLASVRVSCAGGRGSIQGHWKIPRAKTCRSVQTTSRGLVAQARAAGEERGSPSGGVKERSEPGQSTRESASPLTLRDVCDPLPSQGWRVAVELQASEVPSAASATVPQVAGIAGMSRVGLGSKSRLEQELQPKEDWSVSDRVMLGRQRYSQDEGEKPCRAEQGVHL